MCLVCESELLCLTNLVNILILFLFFILLVILRFLLLLRRDFLNEILDILKQFVGIDPRDCIYWHIRIIVLKSTMHEDVTVDLPAGMTEALHSIELVPLGGLSVIDFHGHILADSVCATTHNDHQRTKE